MAGTCLHVSGARKLSDDVDDTETIDLAVRADGGDAGASAAGDRPRRRIRRLPELARSSPPTQERTSL